jgi:hypothetical protein
LTAHLAVVACVHGVSAFAITTDQIDTPLARAVIDAAPDLVRPDLDGGPFRLASLQERSSCWARASW